MAVVLQTYYPIHKTLKTIYTVTIMKLYRTIIIFLIVFVSVSTYSIADTLIPSTVIVAAVQLKTRDIGNFNKMRELVKEAKAKGATLVIFPEDSVFSWLNPDVFLKSAPIPGKYSNEFAAIAKDENIWLAAGLGEQGPKAGPGSLKDAHQAYDAGILINPDGQIVLHHRQFNVVKNAFDPSECKRILNQDQCSYTVGDLSDITTTNTPFGKTSILVCADAYTYPSTEPLDRLKQLQPDFVIIFWGITASTQSECGTQGFDATTYAAEAAMYINSAFVVGSNAVGTRYYGRFLPSEYCGTSGCSTSTGQNTEAMHPFEELIFFHITSSFNSKGKLIWNNKA